MISEHDKAALIALLARYHRATWERDKAKKQVEEATKLVNKHSADASKLSTAFSIFKFDVSIQGVWHDIRDIIGPLEYSKAIAAGEGLDHSSDQPRYHPGGKPDDGEELDEKKAKEVETADANVAPKIRQIVISQLKDADVFGIKASEIKYYIKSETDIEMNEKTVGMTLWRLANQGLAHRIGRHWFEGPAPEEKPEGSGPEERPESVDPLS